MSISAWTVNQPDDTDVSSLAQKPWVISTYTNFDKNSPDKLGRFLETVNFKKVQLTFPANNEGIAPWMALRTRKVPNSPNSWGEYYWFYSTKIGTSIPSTVENNVIYYVY